MAFHHSLSGTASERSDLASEVGIGNRALAFQLKRLDVLRRRMVRHLLRIAFAASPCLVLCNLVLVDHGAFALAAFLDVFIVLLLVSKVSSPFQMMANRYHDLVVRFAAEEQGLVYQPKPSIRLLRLYQANQLLPQFDRARIFDGLEGKIFGTSIRRVRVIAQTHHRRWQAGAVWKTEFAGDVISVSTNLPPDFWLRISSKTIEEVLPSGVKRDARCFDVPPGAHSVSVPDPAFEHCFHTQSTDSDLARKVISASIHRLLVSMRRAGTDGVHLVIKNGVLTLALNHGRLKLAHRNALPVRRYSHPVLLSEDFRAEELAVANLKNTLETVVCAVQHHSVTAL